MCVGRLYLGCCISVCGCVCVSVYVYRCVDYIMSVVYLCVGVPVCLWSFWYVVCGKIGWVCCVVGSVLCMVYLYVV
jgi:hypothetical protein